MNVRFLCPECHAWTTTDQAAAPAWSCTACGSIVPAAASSAGETLPVCRRCGNEELYIQKDFPHWLGMSILVIACAASVVTYAMERIVLTWAILIGSALVDVILYLLVGNVTVCYRCQTQYRGFAPETQHHPFDLAVGEKYRQERLRRQQRKGPEAAERG